MAKSILELVIGNFDEKREWRSMMKRVNNLPEEYSFAYKKMLHYFYHFGCNMDMLTELVELFEVSAAEGKPVLDIVGNDVAAFCDELIRVSGVELVNSREELNQEIMKYFHGEEGEHE